MSSKKVKILILLPAIYFMVNIIIGMQSHFFQIHNDYWDLLHIAKQIDFLDVQSLFNPCIPAGYCLILHYIIKISQSVCIPIIVNLLCGTLVIGASLFFYRKITNEKTAVLSILFLALFPQNLYYFNQGGADPFSVLLFTTGIFMLLRQLVPDKSGNAYVFLTAGIIMGAGAFMRYHVLVGSVIFIFCLFPFYRHSWKLIALSLAGVFIGYSPQILINLLAGHGVFESKLGASNIYDLMYGINWYRLSTDPVPTDAIAIISTDYFLFIKRYVVSFVKFMIQTGAVPLAVALITKDNTRKRLAWFSTAFMVCYFGFFSSTLSGRQILIAIPLTMLFYGMLFEELFSYSRNMGAKAGRLIKMASAGFAIYLICLFVIRDYEVMKNNIKEFRYSSDVSRYLKTAGCESAFQTFTTDYGLSFVDYKEPLGYFNGGWSRWGTYKYNDVYPEFPVDSMSAFVDTCRARGVKFLLLTEDTKKLNAEFYDLYKLKNSVPEITFEKEIDRLRVFRIGGSSL